MRVRDCTCAGSCRGADGLAPGWNCVVDNGPLEGVDRWQPVPVPIGNGRHDIGDDVRAAIVERLTSDWSRDQDLTPEKARQLAMWAGASVRSLLHELGTLHDLTSETNLMLDGPAGGAPAAVDERSTDRATAESTGPSGSFGYCAICYHPLDRCSHCDNEQAESFNTPEEKQETVSLRALLESLHQLSDEWHERARLVRPLESAPITAEKRNRIAEWMWFTNRANELRGIIAKAEGQ